MGWSRRLVDQLTAITPGGYHASGPVASEPTALGGLALAACGETTAARRAAAWLADQQSNDGSLGVTATQSTPCWPTSLAILLWHSLDSQSASPAYQAETQRAVRWALAERGLTNQQQPHVGHDTSLVGWSWAANTHSWLEPTSMFVLALTSVGAANHPRAKEAVRLLVDRLLPSGGANYGNTIVLGQALLPHVQPTGLVMWALGDKTSHDPRIARSLEYLERELPRASGTASLCYGLLGLTAHGRRPAEAEAWLRRRYEQCKQNRLSCYKLALLALASREAKPVPTETRPSNLLTSKSQQVPDNPGTARLRVTSLRRPNR